MISPHIHKIIAHYSTMTTQKWERRWRKSFLSQYHIIFLLKRICYTYQLSIPGGNFLWDSNQRHAVLMVSRQWKWTAILRSSDIGRYDTKNYNFLATLDPNVVDNNTLFEVKNVSFHKRNLKYFYFILVFLYTWVCIEVSPK